VQGAPGFYECKRGHRWHAKSSLRHHVCGMSKGDGHERCNFCWLADPPPPGEGREWRTRPTESSVRQSFMTHRTTHHSSPTACRSCHETKQKRRDWTLLFSQICSNCSPSKPRRCPCCGAALLSHELQCFCCRSDVTPRPSNAASAPQLSKGVLAPAAQPQRSDERSRAALPATPFTIHPSLRPFAAAPPAPSSTAGASSLLAPHTAMPAGLQSVARQGAERAPLGSRRSRRHRNSLHWLILCLAPLFFAFPVSVRCRLVDSHGPDAGGHEWIKCRRVGHRWRAPLESFRHFVCGIESDPGEPCDMCWLAGPTHDDIRKAKAARKKHRQVSHPDR